MRLNHEMHLGVGPPRAWAVLTDLDLIAPCVPGLTVANVKGSTRSGVLRAKMGPTTLEYEGSLRLLSVDEEERRALLAAEGVEVSEGAPARAEVTMVVEPAAGGTRVLLTTDLEIGGKAAGFGSGIIGEVGEMLLATFRENLSQTVLADELAAASTPPEPEAEAGEPAPQTGRPVARAIPVVVVLVGAWVLRSLVRRRRRR